MPAYAEDNYTSYTVKSSSALGALGDGIATALGISGGQLQLTNQKQCGRCVVITQDIETGKVVSKETLKILADERKQENSSKIPFGVYLTPSAIGTLHLNDQIECRS